MKVHNYTPCLFGLLLLKEKEKKNKSVTKYDAKKKRRKTNLFTKISMTQSVSFFSFFFFFFFASQSFQANHFVLAVWKRLLAYPPCNQVYKRSQQNACTHWSTASCDVIRHPKTAFARWSILPTKLICLMCRFAFCQQYAILYSGQKFHSFFFFAFSCHRFSVFFSG